MTGRTMSEEPDIVVHDREQLIALLTEAAEIEHGLMCCYLYAAFSLKTTDDSGLSPEQLAATRRWRAAIIDVAVEEMLHLGLVANLMTAIGSTPHFARPNFPVSAGYHPSGVVVELSRFCKETVDHFVYLERPEGMDIADGSGFGASNTYVRATRADVLVPSAQDFLTVGYLYRAIAEGFSGLERMHGHPNLFIGAASAQMSPELTGFDKLIRVTDLASARAAIDAIVEQGEGSPGHTDDGHYVKFCKVRDELVALVAADPGFEPAWPVARNPVMRKPPNPDGKVHISAPEAARLLDIGNAAYGLMLRCLMGAFGQPSATDDIRGQLYSTAIQLMHAVVPIAERLARLPASMDANSPTAGLTFTLPRSITPVPDAVLAQRLIAERAAEIARAASACIELVGPLDNVAKGLERIAISLDKNFKSIVRSTPVAPMRTSAPSSASVGSTAAASVPAIEEAIGEAVIIHFQGKRCIHARFCVLQAPTVFQANTPGTWIYPNTMDAERLIAVAENCPSGAITYQRRDGQLGETPPPVNALRIRENGAYAVHANIDLAGQGILTRATLCRCGASKNKPFCDGSHNDAHFLASGEPSTRESEPLAVRDGVLTVSPQRNGPLAISGSLEICSGTGRTVDRVTSARLCRCGGSSNKPFCDGTHTRIGFKSDQ
jgi:CDGSH-type Zn-finger protein/uncharacterized Fe-S cluster protein YjdI